MMSSKATSGIGFIILMSAAFTALLLASPIPASCALPTESCPPGTVYGSGLRNPTQTASTMDEALGTAQKFLVAVNNPDLVIDKIIEFEKHFYVIYDERSTGRGAFAIIISKPGAEPLPLGPNGLYRPGEGPNSMWDTRYGLAAFRPTGYGIENYDVSAAMEQAFKYLNENIPGAEIGDVHPFYGYVTLEILKDGKVYGIISVQSFTGTVLFHDGLGSYIQTRNILV